jgi:hypothetical protein
MIQTSQCSQSALPVANAVGIYRQQFGRAGPPYECQESTRIQTEDDPH